jgi:transcriptional regulator with XRE-family HTH domain
MPPAEVDAALAAAIRHQRQARGATQEAVAYTAGVTVGTYRGVESGRINLTWATLKCIARGLGVTTAELAVRAERVEEPATT